MSRRLYTYIMLVATIVLSITGCMDRRQGATASRHPKDTLYTEQRAMEAYDYQPERALQMVDSAVAVGDMSHWWGEMLRARIYSSTLAPERLDSIMHWREGARLDSAKAIGERLLEDDSVRADLARQQDVLEILAYTARQQNDTLGWLQCSRELVEVCHGQGAVTEALRNEAEVDAALCFLGKETEGMARIDSVEYPLDVTGKTWQYFRLEILNTRNSLSPKLPSRPPSPQRSYCAATTASDAVYRVSAENITRHIEQYETEETMDDSRHPHYLRHHGDVGIVFQG